MGSGNKLQRRKKGPCSCGERNIKGEAPGGKKTGREKVPVVGTAGQVLLHKGY